MQRNDIIKFLLLRTVGNFLVLFALFGVGATFGPALYYEVLFQILQAKGVTYKVETVAQAAPQKHPTASDTVEISEPGLGSILTDTKEQVMIPKDTLFDVMIPKIGANAKVFANVDPTNEDEYVAVLKKGVAHAKGSVFPGMIGTTYLFAHSTDSIWDVGRYNAVFYLLKDLNNGDDVIVFFQNKRYNYKVVDKKIVAGDDVSYLVNAQKVTKQQLILQTCWPPGTSWERILVFAEPAK